MENVVEQQVSNGIAALVNAMEENILAQLPLVLVKRCFGLRSMRPHGHCVCQQTMPLTRKINTSRSAMEH